MFCIGKVDKEKTKLIEVVKECVKLGLEEVRPGGTFNIDSKDDSIYSNNSVSISSGEFNINAGDDGIHGDSTLTIKIA